MGSVWHARSLAAAGREVQLMLSLEMIGYFSDAPNSQKYPVAGMQYLYSGTLRKTRCVSSGTWSA